MDMYQKRKIRQEKVKNEDKEENSKSNINWYPGHMAKTKKQIIQDLKLIDIVIELLDARIPISSQNPNIAEITKNKKKIIVLNKCDLSDDKENKRWVEYFKKKNIPAVLVDSNSGRGIDECIRQIEKIMQIDLDTHAEKGRTGRRIRAMILGIPNVGKSSFINRVSKKTSMRVGNKPGVTKNKQWIRLTSNIELLDTPGVLWPKIANEQTALNLAYTGTIKSDIIDEVEIAYNLVKFLIEKYRKNLIERYKLNSEIVEKINSNDELEENEKIVEIMNYIGEKRGTVSKGNNIDLEKISKIILEDFRTGNLGKITLEVVA